MFRNRARVNGPIRIGFGFVQEDGSDKSCFSPPTSRNTGGQELSDTDWLMGDGLTSLAVGSRFVAESKSQCCAFSRRAALLSAAAAATAAAAASGYAPAPQRGGSSVSLDHRTLAFPGLAASAVASRHREGGGELAPGCGEGGGLNNRLRGCCTWVAPWVARRS